MRSRLDGMPVAHVLRLIQDGAEAALFDGQLEMQPRQIAAALGNFRQSVAAQVNHRQRLDHRAKLRDEQRTLRGNRLAADDHRQPIVRTAVRRAAELGRIADADRLEVQEAQQSLKSSRLRI